MKLFAARFYNKVIFYFVILILAIYNINQGPITSPDKNTIATWAEYLISYKFNLFELINCN